VSALLVGIGGAHVDRRGRVLVPFVAGASNPGVMREEAGGGVFNALRGAAARGAASLLVSVRGGDGAGEAVAAAAEATGVADASAIFLDRRTATYTAILDENGDVVAALADMAIYEECFTRALRRRHARDAIRSAGALLVDANPPAAAIALALAIGPAPAHAIAISPAKVGRLAPVLARLSTLFMNRREAAALTGLGEDAAAPALAGALRVLGLARGVITDGPRPLVLFDDAGVATLAPPPAEKVADVTGAGDMLAGACAAALLRGLPFRAALREGVAAALIKLERPEAATAFPAGPFAAMLARVPAL